MLEMKNRILVFGALLLALSASAQQCAAIRKLIEVRGFEGIPPELREIAGGRFNFDTDYDMAMRAANIKCPICGSEGTLRSQIQGFEGYSDGRWVAVDTCVCTSCHSQINLYPELKAAVIAKDLKGFGTIERGFMDITTLYK